MKSTFLLLFLAFTLACPKAVTAQGPLDDVETLLGQGRILQARDVLLRNAHKGLLETAFLLAHTN